MGKRAHKRRFQLQIEIFLSDFDRHTCFLIWFLLLKNFRGSNMLFLFYLGGGGGGVCTLLNYMRGYIYKTSVNLSCLCITLQRIYYPRRHFKVIFLVPFYQLREIPRF